MESIEINGFLTIDHAHFEIKKINVLIGAQAQGKSVIAKLVYFFKNFFSDNFVESIRKLETNRELNKQCLVQFEQIFPRYTWANQQFSIIYKNEDYQVSIIRIKSGNKYALKFDYGKNLTNLFNTSKNNYKKKIQHQSDKFTNAPRDNVSSDEILNSIKMESLFFTISEVLFSHSAFKNIYKKPIFIPANRAFFANLQKNIFSFLAEDIDIEPLIKKFGAFYQQSKRLHHQDFFL